MDKNQENRNSYLVTVGGKTREYPAGITYGEIATVYQKDYPHQIALAVRDGKIRELFKKVDRDCTVEFLTLTDDTGHKTYNRTAILILMKAIQEVVGADKIEKIKLEFAIGNGLYCSKKGDFEVTDALVAEVKAKMQEYINKDLYVIKRSMPLEEANIIFSEQKMEDKVNLFKYRGSSTVNVYNLDGYKDYYYGYMLPSTGYVKHFDLRKYEDGFVLILPEKKNPEVLEEFKPLPKLFHAMSIATDWGEKLGVDTVADLNDEIRAGRFNELVLVQEALQERRISEIASDIVSRGGVKFVMIAGPSSSGKTTFSHRLSVQLKTHGLVPHPIAVDDYFVNRENTPRQPNGDYDFECLEAIDMKQFNEDMLKLLAGERVELPTFNFVTGKREYKGNYKQLGPDDVLVIEGIHGLNDKMSYALPAESKYKIYISALTSLNIDEHNRIPTTDGRLLRRMVRDARTRGATAKRTIQMWPSVRNGEEENIFPFQESADAMFNSALIYELAVLKQYAEPLLYNIEKGEPEYFEAVRLLKFLSYFLGVSTEELPKNSIVREFVGGSCFKV
ncbi:nucleoside kinase [Lachnospiraceae bacterium MD335]|jgi:uridine kinase|nr:nucleoside kinase [Lachnospiraceae bacterium MD335]